MATNESETIPEETKTTTTDEVKTTPENTEAKNAENETSAEPLSELDKKVIRQIEVSTQLTKTIAAYYFYEF